MAETGSVIAGHGKIRVLVVCMWPLGGIRTYLKYNYQYFPKDRFEVTLLANPAIEREAVQADMEGLGIRVVWAPPVHGKDLLAWRVFELLRRERYDVIHSQGFLSAFHTGLVNRFGHTPHAMTIHGVLEEKRFAGTLGRVKRWVFERVMGDVDVIVSVGQDILTHVQAGLPVLRERSKWTVIRNGIDPSAFVKDYPGARARVRELTGGSEGTFVFGSFGRFMPEKGFPYLIDAVKILMQEGRGDRFVVLALGSGDYEKQYRERVTAEGLTEKIRFLPFQRNVAELMQGCDAVVMPSVWEAYPLLTSEVFCCGVPLIASDCPGLREAVLETPAVRVRSRDARDLAAGMIRAIEDRGVGEQARAFRAEAATRYDVRRSAEQLIGLLEGLGQGVGSQAPTERGIGTPSEERSSSEHP